MICLDTNAVIAIINGHPSGVRSRLEAEIGAGLTIGIPVIASR